MPKERKPIRKKSGPALSKPGKAMKQSNQIPLGIGKEAAIKNRKIG